MSKKRQQKQKRKWRHKKVRNSGRSYRAVTVSNITEEGFDIEFKQRQYHINRDAFAWFLGATDDEIRDNHLVKASDPDDHGDFWVIWDTLDIWLGTKDFDDPEGVYDSTHVFRDRYYESHPEITRQKQVK